MLPCDGLHSRIVAPFASPKHEQCWFDTVLRGLLQSKWS